MQHSNSTADNIYKDKVTIFPTRFQVHHHVCMDLGWYFLLQLQGHGLEIRKHCCTSAEDHRKERKKKEIHFVF